MYQSILPIFGIFKLLQKQLKLQLKFENSCQTLVKYIQGTEMFKMACLLRLIISYNLLVIMKVINYMKLFQNCKVC